MESLKNLTELKLMERLKAGDESAHAEAYERFWEPLFRYAVRALQDRAQAEDAVQDVFLGLWHKHSSIGEHGNLSGYLYRAVRNRVLNLIDKSRIRQAFLDTVANTSRESSWTADERLREQELAQQIEQGMEQMPKGMRRVFELSRQQDMSHKEIADGLSISENTVKVQVSRALKILRKNLTLLLSLSVYLIIN